MDISGRLALAQPIRGAHYSLLNLLNLGRDILSGNFFLLLEFAPVLGDDAQLFARA